MTQKKFWDVRSEKYDRLEWVKDTTYLDGFVKAAKLKKSDVVLDVGCGTGIITTLVSPKVRQVIGLDKSQEMLKKSNFSGNKYFILQDIRKPLFTDEVFDKVTARMVFHHITRNTQRAMDECYKVLKKNGLFILAEGVPPNKKAKNHYAQVFKLKEKRITFFQEDLEVLMKNAGFKKVSTAVLTIPLSIKNWLENSGLPPKKITQIFNVYRTAPQHIKDSYEMKTTKKDVIIQTKNLIITGTK